jgi:hypothetical protein
MQSNEPGCYNNEKEGLPLLSVAASAGKKFNSLLELYAIKKKHKRSTSSIGPNHAPCTMYLQPTFGPPTSSKEIGPTIVRCQQALDDQGPYAIVSVKPPFNAPTSTTVNEIPALPRTLMLFKQLK